LAALTLSAAKLVLRELSAFHATGHHFINTYPGGLDALAKQHPTIFTVNMFEVDFCLGSNTQIMNYSATVAKTYNTTNGVGRAIFF
jgi:hypothetical protein